MNREWDVVIVGGGPAGLSAAIYCGRALRKTLVIEKKVFGGQIVDSDIIENYPGFTEAVVPSELMDQFQRQAEKYGVEFENDEVTAIHRQDDKWRVDVYDNHFLAEAVIYTAGASHRFLHVPGEQELFGRGVSVCATCDAPFFVNRRVAVIGGGDTAVTEALHLAKFAAEVHVIHRRDQLRCERILQERARQNDKIHFVWDTVVERFLGKEKLEGLELRNKKSGAAHTLPLDGAFIAIGNIPNTALVRDFVELDEAGFVVSGVSMKTRTPGLFCAGELIKDNGRQVAVSVGMGVQAALSCEEYLTTRERPSR